MISTKNPLDTAALAVARTLYPRLPALQGDERLDSLFWHWIASGYAACSPDYNCVVNLREGPPARWNVDIPTSPRANAVQVGDGAPYAAHTYGRNSHAIAISVAAMGGANVGPANFGPYPVQEHEIETLCAASAALQKRYGIANTAARTMTHAEAAILDGYFVTDRPDDGITRWDLARLAPSSKALTKAEAIATGNLLRARTAQYRAAL